MAEGAEDLDLALKQLHRLLVVHELVLLNLCTIRARQTLSQMSRLDREQRWEAAPLMATSSCESRLRPRLTSAKVPEPIWSLAGVGGSYQLRSVDVRSDADASNHSHDVVLVKDLALIELPVGSIAEQEAEGPLLCALASRRRRCLSRRCLLAKRNVVAVLEDTALIRGKPLAYRASAKREMSAGVRTAVRQTLHWD